MTNLENQTITKKERVSRLIQKNNLKIEILKAKIKLMEEKLNVSKTEKNKPKRKKNNADEWFKNKMSYEVTAKGKCLKCGYCPKVFFLKNAFEKHTKKCKGQESWKVEWVEDTEENRKKWKRS